MIVNDGELPRHLIADSISPTVRRGRIMEVQLQLFGRHPPPAAARRRPTLTVAGSGIGIESETGNRIKNGTRIRIENRCESEIENGNGVEGECKDEIRKKSVKRLTLRANPFPYDIV
ncbi:hypothetical protein EVAR_98184_1 [Eumeta japonica]|uniref:Uncharacterized protein n=1 Tax=Eumeta variegata TaxID=151549 RepID=A0A4C2A4I2_EUMVA|nr:hypothetical protein EVAR_98184_1 [Eumeta japonica]